MLGRSRLRWLTGLVALAVVLLSPYLGRAEPTGSYRPGVPPDALASGCYPLPAGVVLDLPYQVRSDTESFLLRYLRGHYDLLDADDARAAIVRSFEAEGFTTTPGRYAGDLVMTRVDIGSVGLRVTPLPGVPDDSIVRGEFLLTLPRQPLAPGREDDPDCRSPYVTKRFPASTTS